MLFGRASLTACCTAFVSHSVSRRRGCDILINLASPSLFSLHHLPSSTDPLCSYTSVKVSDIAGHSNAISRHTTDAAVDFHRTGHEAHIHSRHSLQVIALIRRTSQLAIQGLPPILTDCTTRHTADRHPKKALDPSSDNWHTDRHLPASKGT